MDPKTEKILIIYIAVVALSISYFVYPVFASPLSGNYGKIEGSFTHNNIKTEINVLTEQSVLELVMYL